MPKAAKKGNVTAMKWLYGRFELARTAELLEQRAEPAAPPKQLNLGKKEQRQADAEKIVGKFEPPPGPTKKLH